MNGAAESSSSHFTVASTAFSPGNNAKLGRLTLLARNERSLAIWGRHWRICLCECSFAATEVAAAGIVALALLPQPFIFDDGPCCSILLALCCL